MEWTHKQLLPYMKTNHRTDPQSEALSAHESMQQLYSHYCCKESCSWRRTVSTGLCRDADTRAHIKRYQGQISLDSLRYKYIQNAPQVYS